MSAHRFTVRCSFPCALGIGLVCFGAASGQSIITGGSCFKDEPDSACNHYTDNSPQCPDFFFGGGQCGNPVSDPAGTGDEQQSITPSCLVNVREEDADGNCFSVGTFNVQVSCLQTGGQACQ